MPLKPYTGALSDTHKPSSFLRWFLPAEMDGYGRYQTTYAKPHLPERYRLDGDWGYQFNSLGFRCEEYNPIAPKHIFACGCSYTFGQGIRVEQSYPHVFKEKYAEMHGLRPDDVNLLNFSQSGASNDYIARMSITQCAEVKPDLLLVMFTSADRLEYVDDKGIESIGWWIETEPSLDYFCLHTAQLGLINTLKNILLLQYFCKHHSIPYLFSVFFWGELENPQFAQHPAIAPFLEQLDRRYLCPFSLIDYRCDVARMCHHPGPLSNLRFGRKLFVHYRRLREQGLLP